MKNKQKVEQKIGITLLIFSILLIIICGIFVKCGYENDTLPTVEPKNKVIETTSELDFTPRSTESRAIHIPSTNRLTMKAGQLEQEIDLYNPKENRAIIQIDIVLSDGTIIYQSSYLNPDEHINQIMLTQPLESGVYRNCKIIYRCYAPNGETKLNSLEVKVEINAI